MRLFLAVAVSASFLAAEEPQWAPISAPENPVLGQYLSGNAKSASNDAQRSAFLGEADIVFPHVATGDGWETVMVVVNMTTRTMEYKTYFYDQAGKPMKVSFRNYPQGQVVTDSGIVSRLPPGSSFNFALFDSGGPLQQGWAILDYDTSVGRLGGYAIFRQRVSGRAAIPEALIPLSAMDDSRFMMPVDNIQGFETAMAIVNPASNLPNRVTFTFLGLDGKVIGTSEMTLGPGAHTAFVLRDKFPNVPLANTMGTLLVESNLNRLSALGIRFNSTGTFASIPIMNWAGMF